MKNDIPPRYFPLKYTITGTFLLLILSVLAAVSLFAFGDAKSDMQEAYLLQQRQTEVGILRVIEVAEAGYNLLENFYDQEMKNGFAKFIKAYEASGRNPARMDLEMLKKKLGGKMDLYIINADGIVEHATYATDIGMDFKRYPEFYKSLTLIRKNKEFVSDGLKIEARTGKPRMYAFMPTPDNRYLLEFGLIYKEFEDILGGLDMRLITRRLKVLNPSLLSVRIFAPNGNLLGNPDYKPDPVSKAIIQDVYREKGRYEIHDELGRRDIHYVYTHLATQNTFSNRNKVIELIYSTWLIKMKLDRKSWIYFTICVLAVSTSIFCTFWLADWITGPIKRIVKSINVIAQGDLKYPIHQVNAKNELKILKQSIIVMVSNTRDYIERIREQNEQLRHSEKTLREAKRLQDEYNLRLEQEVAERTRELRENQDRLVTAKERAERAERRAHQANQTKSVFLANMSHEIRTPMNAVLGFAEILRGKVRDKKQQEYLAAIETGGKTLLSLISDILDLSKVEAGKLELQYKQVDVGEVFRDMAQIFSQKLTAKGLDFNIQIDASLPNILIFDETRLRQILINLIGNAVKFTDTGSITLKAVCEDIKANTLTFGLSVADTGIGIPEDQRERIFGAFEQQSGQNHQKYGGTGLGLAITKRLAELMGGSISVSSETGKGAVFTIVIKDVEFLSAERITEEKQESGLDTNAIRCENARILVVDDRRLNRELIKGYLADVEFEIVEAENGQQGIEQALSCQPDIILMDMKMPVMGGREASAFIKQHEKLKKIPIIAITASVMKEDEKEIKTHCDGFLGKPFSKRELVLELARFLSVSTN